MTTLAAPIAHAKITAKEYKRRIHAWTMYDWANSAFASIILATILPIYYSQVAGATLPSEAVATSYWSLGLAISLSIAAILSPILGTISDVMRGKKLFLSLFTVIGVVGTGLLVLVSTGDWLLASVLVIVAKLGFNGSLVFYDALLPHVAKPEDRDAVSSRGYAMGYLGGALLLTFSIAMMATLPGMWGARLSFLGVAIWWAIFSISIFRHVPEPLTAATSLATGADGASIVKASFKRLGKTLREIGRYRELFKYLIAFLIYNDGISTLTAVAAIYGAELGLGSTEMILALLLVQFVGIPFSLVFGRLPNKADARRPLYLAFVLFNLIALPLGGFFGTRLLPENVTGMPLPSYEATNGHAGQGIYSSDSVALAFSGNWQSEIIAADRLRVGGLAGFFAGEFGKPVEDALYQINKDAAANANFAFNGQKVKLTYSSGPDRGIWLVEMDGQPLVDQQTGKPLEINAYNSAVRYGVTKTFSADKPGEHILALVNTGRADPNSSDTRMALAQIEVLPPVRQSNILWIGGLVLGIELVIACLAFLSGKALFSRLAETLDTKRSIILALSFFPVVSVWGYFLNSTLEFWFLACMLATVQGGSRALSRSLYTSMSPATKSGEFFGLLGVMHKCSSITGPLLFAAAGLWFGSSRPAILSLIILFISGIILLSFVDVPQGQRVAQAEDTAALTAL